MSQLGPFEGWLRHDQVGRRIRSNRHNPRSRSRAMPRVGRVGAGRHPEEDGRVSAGIFDLDPREGYTVILADAEATHVEHGIRWTLDGMTLEMGGRVVIPFLPDDRMNRWSSVDRVELGHDRFVCSARTTVHQPSKPSCEGSGPGSKDDHEAEAPSGVGGVPRRKDEKPEPPSSGGPGVASTTPPRDPWADWRTPPSVRTRVYLTGRTARCRSIPVLQGHPLRVRLNGRLIRGVKSDLEESIPLTSRG